MSSMCRGDEILDKINAVLEEKFNITTVSYLVEQNTHKEQRILMLERSNSELITEVQSLRMLSDQNTRAGSEYSFLQKKVLCQFLD